MEEDEEKEEEEEEEEEGEVIDVTLSIYKVSTRRLKSLAPPSYGSQWESVQTYFPPQLLILLFLLPPSLPYFH